MISVLGYTVENFTDGYEAEKYYRLHWKEISLAIIDLTMPKMSGIECFKKLRRINPQIRTLFSTGHSYNLKTLKKEIGVKGNTAAFLQKPFTLNRFEKKLKDLINDL